MLCLALLGFFLQFKCHAQEDLIEDTMVQTLPSDEETNVHNLVDPDELETTQAYLSEPVKMRPFDEHKWKSIVGSIDFKETIEVREEKSYSPLSGNLLRVISFVVIAGLLITLVYYLTRYISVDYKIERSKLETDDLARPVENIAELDIERLLAQAKHDGHYKLAVRLYYLGLLKKLNDRGAIVWKKDKTNRDYLAELFSANIFFDEVKKLTRSYEAVWYGDHDLKPDTFTVVAAQFESIYGKLKTKENT